MLERLQKIISRAGITSRRHAEELILSGQVRVNGVVITELGVKADPDRDKIEAAGKVATISESRAYVLLHKPPQIVSTIADPEGQPPRAASPAEGLHGRYQETDTYTDGNRSAEVNFDIQTYCLRTGQRCLSY